jgi:[acyl-carrier-protein] S-malonyltransferase
MAAILALDDKIVEDICASLAPMIVVPANYNCPGQLVISGEVEAVNKACELMKEAGAKRALVLQVDGAFHSPLMKPAEEELGKAIESTVFQTPTCPVYQNATAKAVVDPSLIKQNLMKQLTAPVLWTQSVINMSSDGAGQYSETGPGKVLQGLIKKIIPQAQIAS